jgi:hypothetical protein
VGKRQAGKRAGRKIVDKPFITSGYLYEAIRSLYEKDYHEESDIY